MGIFPGDMEQVYDIVIVQKLRQTGSNCDSKSHQRVAGTMQNGIPVIVCLF